MSLANVIFSVSLLVYLSAGGVEAQSTKPEDKPFVEITPQELQPLELSPGGRIARAFQYQLGLVEQTGPIPGPTSGTFLQPPEHYLIQHSLMFDFSELFLKSSDFANILKAYYEGVIAPGKRLAPKNSEAVSLDQLCPKSSPLQCIADSGAWWKRALSGVTGTFSLSERQRVVGAIVLPEGPFPADYDRTGQITFDPAQLFINGSNWSAALSVLAEMRVKVRDPNYRFNEHEQKYTRADRGSLYEDCFAYSATDSRTEVTGRPTSKDHPELPLFDFTKMKKCISAFGGSKRGGVGFLAAAVPKFTFKRASQFDFVKSSGVLIPTPFGEPAVNSYTFIWDLKRLIAPRSARLAVLDGMTQPSKVAKQEEADLSDKSKVTGAEAAARPQSSKVCVTMSHGQHSFLTVPSSFTNIGCRDFASNLDKEGQYGLGCVLSDHISLSSTVDVNLRSGLPPENACNW
jgi:hypothetical protein